MSQVLLIDPPWYRLFDRSMQAFPTSLCSLAAYLERKDIDVKVWNGDLCGQPAFLTGGDLTQRHDTYRARLRNPRWTGWESVAAIALKERPKVVGIGIKTAQFDSALMVARIVRKALPRTIVVVGGPHPTLRPQDFVDCEDVDAIIRGEGELPFLRLVQAALSDSQRGSLLEKLRMDKVFSLSVATNPIPLDSLPPPARHLLIDSRKLAPAGFGRIIGSRGCPWQCEFCCSPILWGRRIRYRSPHNVLSEIITTQKAFGTFDFAFEDDCLLGNRRWAHEFCQAVKQVGVKIRWGALARANLLNESLLQELAAAGLSLLEVGIESGNERTLRETKKGIRRADSVTARQLCKDAGVRFLALVMLGFPWESECDVMRTIDFAIGLKPSFISYSFVTPYPGTPLFATASSMGLIPPDTSWSEFYHQSPALFFYGRMNRSKAKQLMFRIERTLDDYNVASMMRDFPRPGARENSALSI